MKPHIICHMLTTIDGRIDGKALRSVQQGSVYEDTGSNLNGDAWVCGRVTMQQHFAEPESFETKEDKAAGKPSTYVAMRAESYAVAVDTHGTLQWKDADLDGDHLACVLSEQVAEEYLNYLRGKAISYIVTGASTVDLKQATEILSQEFGIRTLLLEGGGKINGAFLESGLVDEVSLLLAPGIDGRDGIPLLFDGRDAAAPSAVPMRLRSVEKLENDILWIRYDVLSNEQKA